MAREYFKDLPNTTTPLRAERINGLLNGEESIEKIVAGSIEGKNLFDKNTITITQGSFSYINGNETTDNTRIRSSFFKIEPNTTYTISINSVIGEIGIVYKQSDNSTIIQGIGETTNNNYYTFTTPSNAYYMRFRLGNSSNIKTAGTEYNIQLEKGNQATDYVPFTKYGYNEDTNVGKLIVEKISGKNLYDGIFRQGNQSNINTTTAIMNKTNIKLNGGKTYTISTNLDSSYKYAITLNAQQYPTSNSNFYDSGWKTTNFTFTPSQDGYIAILVVKSDLSTLTPNNIANYYFQLEIGSTATDYVPFTKYGYNSEKSMGNIVVDKISGKNLFDKDNDIINGYYLNNIGGTTASPNDFYQDKYIKINTDKITVNSSFGYTKILEYDENKNFLHYTSLGSALTLTITLQNNTKYIRISGNKASLPSIQVEEGSTATDYVPYMKYGYNSEESMGNIVVDGIEGKNLYNAFQNSLRNGLWISGTNIGSNASGWYVFIKIEGGKTYTISKKNTYGGIHATTTSSTPNVNVPIVDAWQGDNGIIRYTIKTSYNANYLFLGLGAGSLTDEQKAQAIEELQIEEGSEATSYTPFETYANSESEVYSTNEIKIGRWTDGKPLYRKVINTTLSSSVSSSTSDWKTIYTDTNIKLITDLTFRTVSYNTHYFSRYEEISFRFNDTNGTLAEYHTDDYNNSRSVVITIEYTKTTD